MAVNNLGESWSNASVDSAEKSAQWLIQAIQKENEKIYERGQSKPEYLGMGTTVVGAILLPDSFVLANVGDSRAYLVRDQHMLQLTEDHSLVNELVKSGRLLVRWLQIIHEKCLNTFFGNAWYCRSRCNQS